MGLRPCSDHGLQQCWRTIALLHRDLLACADMIHTEIVNGDYNSTFVVERSQRDISRVIFGAVIGSAHLGEISYRVPEPGTLALFAMTLGLAGFARRRTHLNR